jgi:putative flippase GtrA
MPDPQMEDTRARTLRDRLGAMPTGLVQLVRFAIVGGGGTITNLALFFVAVDVTGMAPLLGAVFCFAVAVTQNYVVNELWTFAVAGGGRLAWRRYWKFVVASLAGLAVNALALAGLIAVFDFPLLVIPQAIGIAAGMAVNFVTSRRIVVRGPH